MKNPSCRNTPLRNTIVPALLAALVVYASPAGRVQAQTANVSVSRSGADASSLTWKSDKEGVSLLRGDETVLRYIFRSGNKPIIYPLIGPNGQSMTRGWPMQDAPAGGSTDHVHQRSLWLTHGEVNGIDFWAEGAKSGVIEHQSVDEVSIENEVATLRTTAHWLGSDGKPLLLERRTTRVDLSGPARVIDLKADLQAIDSAVNFGDTKEGSFGIRVPDSMAVSSKLGGTIVNDKGQKDGEAWAQQARWVDYSGPVEGETAGISVLEHPSSFGHPCRWHVRTYGLFAANPFGVFHFVGGDKTAGHTLKAGDSLRLYYRVILHNGPAQPDQIQRQWDTFAASES